MPNMEKLQSFKLICEGGLNSNQNSLLLSDRSPGAATTLINFESSLFGGYRRIDGYEPLEPLFPEVDAASATGKIYNVTVYNQLILAARKQTAGATYKIYKWVDGGAWSAYVTGLALVSTGVAKIRSVVFNFTGEETVSFADGVNQGIIFNGTTWAFINPASTGADYAHAGGAMALDNPKYLTEFKSTLFMAGDSSDPNVVAYSAPNAEYDWTAANGAGQIVCGFGVRALKSFRDELYVFGDTKIKKIVVDGTDFVLQDVANNIGCIASDSVQEINGDLQFLSQDGFRTIAGTEKIGDVELAVVSKDIQQDVIQFILSADLNNLDSVIVRRKAQVRYFFSDENLDTELNDGIIGCLVGSQDTTRWEWGKLRGIRTSSATSGYIASQEYVIHGDHNGKVYRQESGSSFDSANITAVYSTPDLDFGEVHIRKTLHKIMLFIRAEGALALSVAIVYDWGSGNSTNPPSYLVEDDVVGSTYGVGLYGTAIYATTASPVFLNNIEGSGFANRLTFASSDMNEGYSIQGIVYEFAVDGRK